jgi:hypothetical protein
MDFMLNIDLPKADTVINHQHKILSVGSCFTEHIGNALKELKFDVLQNPNGILFDPVSVCSSLVSYIGNEQYGEDDLFCLNELWHSWRHHSRFSGIDKHGVISGINASQTTAHHFLKEADWLIITLGSSFSYRLVTGAADNAALFQNLPSGAGGVANCHRAPAQWFQKHLLAIDETVATLDNAIHQLFRFNPKLHIIFTISPVRHIRDGVVENNRSKARLLEAVHHLVGKFNKLYYFPAYELVIDVLRDYRFYDIDLVHPNYAATQVVLEHFLKAHTSAETLQLIEELKKIITARKHRSQFPTTSAHRHFLKTHLQKAKTLQQMHPHLNLQQEIAYFENREQD